MSALIGGRSSGRFAQFTWQHPEWWTYAVSVVSGYVMVAHAHEHGMHVHHHLMSPSLEAWHWLLMIVAMMLPLQYDQLRWVAFRSYAERRQPAMLAYVLGFLAVWLLAGAPVVALRAASFTHSHGAAAVAFAAAAVWAFLPSHERAARACHYRRGLVPRGLAGLADTAKHGGQIGVSCVISCWPLMLACAVTGHSIVAMLAGAAISARERFAFRPSPPRNAVGPLVLAGYHALKAL
jgi:hypothetical protein